MANPSKQKGTTAETKVVNYLKAAGISADRLALNGSNDKGDVWYHNPRHGILEVKAGKQTDGYARTDKEDWLQQTITERRNADVSEAYLIIARHRRNVADFEVWSEDGRTFWYLDEFVRAIGGTPQIFKGGKPVGSDQTSS